MSAERVGDHVLLRWTTPSRTTDEMEIEGPMTAQLCRQADPALTAAKLATCSPLRQLAVTPGPSEAVDNLPAALQAEPVTLLTYRIQILNSTGHSAGQSASAAYAAAGQAPEKIASLRAVASERGTVLEWPQAAPSANDSEHVIDLDRFNLSPPPQPKKKAQTSVALPLGKSKPNQSKQPAKQAQTQQHLRAVDTSGGPNPEVAGTLDSTAAMGSIYSYSAQRVRTVVVRDHKLEIQSEPSASVRVAMQDTFPPKMPSGLAAISGYTPAGISAPATTYIDLSWEPNGEADLAGYRVYRQVARPDGSPQGPLARLTTSPISVPAYRDVAVNSGQGYIYTVTAVDAAGNESAPSAKALELVEPLN